MQSKKDYIYVSILRLFFSGSEEPLKNNRSIDLTALAQKEFI